MIRSRLLALPDTSGIDEPIPMQPRSTTGIFRRPLLMYAILAIWLTISPTPSRTKSANMKSITGRVPVIAAPQLRPTNPRSQMGVSQSRTGPYRSNSPAVVLKFPPRLPMPSPMTKIRGSRAISSPSASSVACMKLISCIAPSGFEVPSSVGSVPGGSSYTNRVADAASGQGDASANCRASSTAASTSASVTPFAILQRFFTDPLRLQ